MKIPTFLANMSAKTEKRVLWAIAAVLVMAVIFAFSSQASFASEEASDALAGLLSMEQQDLQTRVSNQSILFGLTLRKLAHIFLFAALGFCLYQALMDVKRRLVIAAGAAYLYGVLDEIHQSLAGRYGRWQDTLIDLIGIALGLAAALLLPKLNTLCKKWFYEDWDLKHPVAKKRLEWCLDALSLAAVMQYVGYRFLQTTMFEFIYSELYKTLTFLSLLVFGGVRFVYYFARKLWADADEKAQIRRFLKFVGVCVLALPFFIVAYLHDYKVLIFIPICWMCLYDIQAELVFKWYVRVIGIMLGATVLCCLAGVVKNLGYFDSIGFVQSYGFINSTDFAAYFIFLLLYAWCAQKCHRRHIILATASFMLVVGLYVYRLTGSRTTLICCILASIVCSCESIGINDERRNKRVYFILKICLTCAFPIMLLTVVVFTYLRGQNNAFATQIDTALSSRLSLTWQVYNKYGIHLFGNSFEMHGIGGSIIRNWGSYDFIDCSYDYLLIRDGFIVTLIIMYVWILTTMHANRSNNMRIALSMMIIAVYSISESHFVDICYNILLVMPFSLFSEPEQLLDHESLFSHTKKKNDKAIKLFVISIAICLGGFGYIMVPKMITWLRTLFYIRQWSHGMHALPSFFLCSGFILFPYVVLRLLSHIWNHQYKQKDGLLVCVIALGILSISANYSVFKHMLAKQQDALNKEKDIVQLVLKCAQQPVYALEKANLYQHSIGGISEGILTPEDILRKREGSILTDKSHQFLVITISGGKYLQFSETSGIYTFDQSVIDALSSLGYEWKAFYDSERTCDLRDLAQLNKLHIDRNGSLILEGPQHSLSTNRYVDQWVGDYEVRFVLHKDKEVEWPTSDDPICTLKVIGNKGATVLTEREIMTTEFDESGYCMIVLPYSIPEVPRIEYRVIAADGITLYLDEITWRQIS